MPEGCLSGLYRFDTPKNTGYPSQTPSLIPQPLHLFPVRRKKAVLILHRGNEYFLLVKVIMSGYLLICVLH